MAEQEFEIITLKDDFARDGLYKVILALFIMAGVAVLLMTASFFLFIFKPSPAQFATDNDWRIIAPVPVDKPYLRTPDLLQWVSDVLPKVFTYDFMSYKKQYENASQYFTANGLQKYSDVINDFVNYDQVQAAKFFVSAAPTNAPNIVNQGLLQGKYSWWVQMTLNLNYISLDKNNNQEIKVQALITRIPTLENLDGVSIDNIIVTKV